MPEIVSDGGRIHYALRGHGTPVVLLHPNHATCESWIDLGWFEALEALGGRPIAPDLRGFGRSEPVTSPDCVSSATSTRDVIAVLDALEVEAAHLCGFSIGGAVAARFAVDQPARVLSLVLGGLALGPLAQLGLNIVMAPEQARSKGLQEVAALPKSKLEAAPEYFDAVRGAIEVAEFTPLIGAQLKVPMLGVSGERDRYRSALIYEDLRNSGASIQIETIPDVGHGGCFVAPQFREAAVEFWSKLLGG
jgi:pimeloyl-ACP methyl ester carboxylesterase